MPFSGGTRSFQLNIVDDSPFLRVSLLDSGDTIQIRAEELTPDTVNILDGQHEIWNDASDSVGWAYPDSRFTEGRWSSSNYSDGIGYASDERSGTPTEPPSDCEAHVVQISKMALDKKSVDQAKVIEAKASDNNLALVETPAKPVMLERMAAQAPAKVAEDNDEVDVTIYTTKRRLKGKDGQQDWMPHFSLSYGIIPNDDFSMVVYLDNDDDISDVVGAEHGKKLTLFKLNGDPENKKRDFTFHITINHGFENNERTFEGTWNDEQGEWEWRGRLLADQKRKCGKCAGVEYGPDGQSTRQQLLMISSFNSEGKDIAQQEGDRIFGKILLASIPDDVKEKLYPNAPELDKAEQAIKDLGPDYLSHAAVVNFLSHLQASVDISPAQRVRINKTKCDAFFPACMAVEKPVGNQADPVQTFGWDREKDAPILDKIQQQARVVALHCYRLGYIRAVTSFRPFLKYASYWYKRLVEYIESPAHLRQFMHRVRSQDDRLERDVYDWHNKLTLLHNVCGDIKGVSKIEEVMSALKGASTLATLDSVEWNDSVVAHLKEFFEKLDEVDNDPLKNKDKEYAKLQKLMAERGASTWSEFGNRIIGTVQACVKHLHRKPSVTELSEVIARQEVANALTQWPKTRTVIKTSIRPITFQYQRGSEYVSLVEGVLLMPSTVIAPIQLGIKYLAKGIGSCLRKIMPQRSLDFINAAKAFGINVNQVDMVIKGSWKIFSKGIKHVFGFFVSCICVWAAADEFDHARKHGRKVDKWFAGTELMLACLGCITLCVQIGAALWGGPAAGAVVAFCGTVGLVLMAVGLTVAVIGLIVTAVLKEDPVRDFINKYGRKYGLLK
ncbi:hypothetical protein Moror_6975 [Moniliophthora roreri MCA 2997]|uniref:Uncharacterized protein n=1 Tax=Moniliophthora roreri (strain MCA 2997) TaxID=1381753 RepID=V2XRU0_MONRO|nr:hypothetical protein Moror_6975 [Moniliophthora roreri MCA 2997]